MKNIDKLVSAYHSARHAGNAQAVEAYRQQIMDKVELAFDKDVITLDLLRAYKREYGTAGFYGVVKL